MVQRPKGAVIVLVAVARSFPEFGSGVDEDTVAVFVAVPVATGVTWIVKRVV